MSLLEPTGYKCLEAVKLVDPQIPVLALLDDSQVEDCRCVVRAGAATAADRCGDIDQIVAALRAATAGMSLLPTRVARYFATIGGHSDGELHLPPARCR